MKERGRTGFCHRSDLKPCASHLQFVEPSKRYADIIFPVGGYNEVGIDLLVARLQQELR